MARLLLIEDDEAFASGLRYNLERAGHTVSLAMTGPDGLRQAQQGNADLIVLDLMLPALSGFDILQALGQRPSVPPVIVLSARDGDADKVRSFALGAIDYVTKPCGLGELLARIRARLSVRNERASTLRLGEAVIDWAAMTVIRHGVSTPLTPTEVELLAALAAKPGQAVDRRALLEDIWGADCTRTRTLDAHINRLRKKIEPNPAQPQHLLTVHGVGYRLVAAAPGR